MIRFAGRCDKKILQNCARILKFNRALLRLRFCSTSRQCTYRKQRHKKCKEVDHLQTEAVRCPTKSRILAVFVRVSPVEQVLKHAHQDWLPPLTLP
eukprot:4175776-Pyramimonas_sp.AAC.1